MDKIKGRVWKFSDNVDTDQIIPSAYCNTFNPDDLAPHAMGGIDPGFGHRVAQGDILVAGVNFGCGSSREAAPIALKASGISCVIAHSFARLFLRNSVNIGLPVIQSPSASHDLRTGEEIEIDFSGLMIRCLSTGRAYRIEQFDGIIQEIIDSGGMVGYVKNRLKHDH